MSDGAKLWIVLARPDRLHAALVACEAVAHRFPGGCHLLREDSSWWERAQWKKYAQRFTSVRAWPRVETFRGLRDLPRLYRETARRRQQMADLPVDPRQDVFLVLGGTLSIANAAISTHPKTFKILGLARHMYEDLIRPIDRRRFRFTTSGWVQNRFVEPLARVEPTINLRSRFRGGGDGARFSRFAREIMEIYDVAIVFSNTGRDLPPHPSDRTLPARFPSIADLGDHRRSAEPSGIRRVVFFGTPFLLIHNLKPARYVERLNQCLNYLRDYYAPRCRLIYRPHPAETSEATELDLRGFVVEDDREVAELYFLEHFSEIEAVYSVSSTVSRVALNNGLNAYCFWRCFDFPPAAAAFFESIMGDVPPEFEVRDLWVPPVAHLQPREPEADGASFGTVLNRALDLRGRR
ncbi:MAG: hypothetical protein M3Z64_05760 [Verrucomicrobiota bacterium]|nr:hypothetical protein [Verrucomicrobiota bacterium]